MCYQEFVHYACGHSNMLEIVCELAEDQALWISVSCPNYESNARNPGGNGMCGKGGYYCGMDQDAELLNEVHARLRQAQTDYRSLTEKKSRVILIGRCFTEQANRLRIPTAQRLQNPDYLSLKAAFAQFYRQRKVAANIWIENESIVQDAMAYFKAKALIGHRTVFPPFSQRLEPQNEGTVDGLAPPVEKKRALEDSQNQHHIPGAVPDADANAGPFKKQRQMTPQSNQHSTPNSAWNHIYPPESNPSASPFRSATKKRSKPSFSTGPETARKSPAQPTHPLPTRRSARTIHRTNYAESSASGTLPASRNPSRSASPAKNAAFKDEGNLSPVKPEPASPTRQSPVPAPAPQRHASSLADRISAWQREAALPRPASPARPPPQRGLRSPFSPRERALPQQYPQTPMLAPMPFGAGAAPALLAAPVEEGQTGDPRKKIVAAPWEGMGGVGQGFSRGPEREQGMGGWGGQKGAEADGEGNAEAMGVEVSGEDVDWNFLPDGTVW